MPGSRTVRFIIAADASQYQRVLSQVESAGGRLVTSQSQLGAKVDATTAKLQHHGAAGRESFLVIGQAMQATGGNFGPFTTALYRLDMIFDSLDSKSGRIAKSFTAAGIAGMVGGSLITAASAKEQSATASLENAVKNAGKSWDDYKGRLGAAAAAQAHFGATKATAEEALATLTTASGDPTKAIKDLTTAEDLAAKQHIKLGDAAQQVASIYGGNLRVLRQFGINTKDIIDPQKELTKAQHDSATANQALATASQHLSDVRQRVAAAQQQSEVDYANAVESAQQKVADSTQKLGDARQRLSDLEDQIHERTKLTVSDQYDQVHAQDALLDVNQKIAAGLLTGQEAYTARRDAEERLAEVHAQHAEKQRMTLSETHQLRNAHTAVTRATEDHASAVEKLQGVRAAGPKPLSLGLRQEEAAAERAYQHAKSRVAHAQKEMAKARADMAAFPSKIQHALDLLNGKVHGAAEAQAHTLSGTFHRWIAQVENWLGGLGTTTGTTITAVSTGVTALSVLAETKVGKAIGGALKNIGKLLFGWGAANTTMVAESAAADATIVAESAVAGTASSLALGPVVLAIAAIGIAAYELYKHWDKVWGAIKWAFDKVWTFLKHHWKEIIAFLVGGLGVYELYKHWHKVWGWIKNVAQDAVNFLIDIFNGLVKVVLAPINLIIDAVNFLIEALNHIHFEIPSWVPFIGGKSFGIHLGKIQHIEFSVGHVHFADSKPAKAKNIVASSSKGVGSGIRAMAGGGYPAPGEVVKVGEHGEELAQFLAPVRIYPNGQARGGDGAAMLTLNLTVNVSGALTREHAYQLGLATADGVHDGLLRKKREGNPHLGLA